MKTRTAFIYLVVFLLLAGYFYYFEVVRRKARTELEEAARHLFKLNESQITALRIDRNGNQSISLIKNGHWQIVEPISTRADEFGVGNILSTLQSLKMEREVDAEAKDLQLYGLGNPALQLSFDTNGTTHQLHIGARTVVGNQYYASGDQENRVLLISSTQQEALDKNLFDLRRKEFFTLKSDEVDGIEIARAKDRLVVARVEKQGWQGPETPETKIKSHKVDEFLTRLILLRAKGFVEDGEENIARFGLDPARIRITLSAKEKKETLLLGSGNEKESIYAKGEEIPGVAMVDEKLLENLPGSISDLEDRTLFSFDSDQVKAVTIKLNDETGRLEKKEEQWKWAGNKDRKEPERWGVNSLIWKLQKLEYLPGASPEKQPSPESIGLDLILLTENKNKLATFSLPELPGEKAERGVLWFSGGDETKRPYWLSAESLQELHESAKKLVTRES